MEQKNFTLRRSKNNFILEKDNYQIVINQSSDNDLWFSTSEDEITMELKLSSRNHQEWQTYLVFESLMKSIIGRYILSGDNQKIYSNLPKDFIDLDNKVINWHSDSGIDIVLKLQYINEIIKISIINIENHCVNSVRIRTSGSSYGYYYQEFIDFFKRLSTLEHQLNKANVISSKKGEQTPATKRLFKNKK